jgi:hypothetical protein
MHKTALSELLMCTPPATLFPAILARIEAEKRRLARIRLAFFGATTFASASALVPIARFLGEGFARSGFTEYFSLVFSDSAVAVLYWKELALSLAQALPLFWCLLLGISVFVLLGSFQLAAKNLRTAFIVPQFA